MPVIEMIEVITQSRRTKMSQAQQKLKEKADELAFDDSAENELDPNEYQHMVAEAAYYKAEKRGFAPGDEEADWFEAEQEVKAQSAG
jgi:Protein of unknown function (DUF2934)